MVKTLIIIDVQKGFISNSSKEVIPKIKKLLETTDFKHILFTKFINTKNSPFRKVMNWHRVEKSPETDIVDELQPFVKKIFTKEKFTPFTTEFESYLKTYKITKLYIVGIDTECCVLKTAVDAFEKGFIPFVLKDYCASHKSDEDHKAGLKVIKRLLGTQQVI